jgi:hypothetical protein
VFATTPSLGREVVLELDVGVRQPADAAADGLWVLEESQIKGCKHQDDADVHYHPFPESILKEQKVYTNDNGNQHHNVKHDRHVPRHSISRSNISTAALRSRKRKLYRYRERKTRKSLRSTHMPSFTIMRPFGEGAFRCAALRSAVVRWAERGQ